MPVNNRTSPCVLLFGLLAYTLPSIAEELPSLDFLEYMGSEESQVDEQWSSPVDMDIEQYLAENRPAENRQTEKTQTGNRQPDISENSGNNSEDNSHE